VIEIFTFRIAAGAGEAAFLDSDQRVQTEFFYQQAGLVRRTTARSADGEWIVITIWASEADVDVASQNSIDDAAHVAFMSFVDNASIRVKRYEALPG
jgi:hypothetical protein